jgi:K+-transporting ATPase ATPase C chain
LETNKKKSKNLRQIIGIAVISLALCGLLFPLLITGIGQALFPYQANGELVTLNGCTVGSNLIAQSFNKTVFFSPRPSSQSASGVDPDIPLQNASAQIPRISNATGIPRESIQNIVNRDAEGTFWTFGKPYVNVLRLNLDLINGYPQVYDRFLPASVQPTACLSDMRK